MAGRLSLVTASNSMTQQPQISDEQAPPSASRQSRASIIETWFEAHNDLAVATISYAVFCLKKKKRRRTALSRAPPARGEQLAARPRAAPEGLLGALCARLMRRGARDPCR